MVQAKCLVPSEVGHQTGCGSQRGGGLPPTLSDLGKGEQVFFERIIKKPVVAHASRDPVS